uniref:Uncharacterized protein n=1 Tax=Ditylenchus dipsaci TaxID=166011 RepID=A0A915DZ85_9BILA
MGLKQIIGIGIACETALCASTFYIFVKSRREESFRKKLYHNVPVLLNFYYASENIISVTISTISFSMVKLSKVTYYLTLAAVSVPLFGDAYMIHWEKAKKPSPEIPVQSWYLYSKWMERNEKDQNI